MNEIHIYNKVKKSKLNYYCILLHFCKTTLYILEQFEYTKGVIIIQLMTFNEVDTRIY